uniref:Uncharacterized protein n=1 Tax=Arundo donax TaxID=35708 RepID=A0A0A8YX66_ARUDO
MPSFLDGEEKGVGEGN